MRSKSKIPKHFAKQDGGGGRRTRRVAMMATILVAIIVVLLAVSPGFGTQLPSVGRPEGQDLSLGFVRVQTKPGITVADTVDQLSAAGVRSQPNYSYSVGEGEDEAPDAQAGAIGSTVASEGVPSDEAAEGGEALDRSATDVPAGATDPSGAAVPADGGNAGGTEGTPRGRARLTPPGTRRSATPRPSPPSRPTTPTGCSPTAHGAHRPRSTSGTRRASRGRTRG